VMTEATMTWGLPVKMAPLSAADSGSSFAILSANRPIRAAPKPSHIEAGYERRAVPEDEAERRAWATVNKGKPRRQKERVRPGQAKKYLVLAQRGTARRKG
jgi:hypothetical protein